MPRTNPLTPTVTAQGSWTQAEIAEWLNDRITRQAQKLQTTVGKYHEALVDGGISGALTWHLMPALSAEYFLNERINGLRALQNLLAHPVEAEGGSDPVAVLRVFLADLTKKLLEWEMLGHSTSEIDVWYSRVKHDTVIEMRQFYAELIHGAESLAQP